ncbi:hypothetical protein DM02DRAFT_619146 [Periconia macrospinosa]|uniref:F-box domain-containing protein n=1 Tax=Periconia macrospinosa TaxID=97972 RepID=A0A2V1D6I6_9PLEO|nr:hypothetical protein DM02DRAFT_619146 [Periconia macrospinosa]
MLATGEETRVPHATPTLMGLSQELRREICEHLRSKDLANVCLVNKTLHDAAVRALYRNISLKLSDEAGLKRVSNLLSRENPGVDHIQTIRLISPCENNCDRQFRKQMFSAMMYFLNGLPRDQLKCFSWDSAHTWRADLTTLLLKRQRKLKYVEIHPTNHELPCLQQQLEDDPGLFKGIENAESLYFHPKQMCCLDTAKMMLKHAKRVKILKLSNDKLSDEIKQTSTNDEGVVTDPVFTKLFSHFKEPGVDPLRLTSLSFRHVDFEQTKANYAQVMVFENLKRLRLNNCYGPELFLESMMQPERGCTARLEELIIRNHQGDREHQLPQTLDAFLASFKGLKNLQLWLVNPGVLPAPRSITWHGETLETLYVGVRIRPRDPKGNWESYTGPDQLKQLATSLPHLKQLALSIADWPNVMQCQIGLTSSDFDTNILSPLAELPKLQVLNILNWPAVGADCDMPIDAYRALLRRHASAFFGAFKEAQVIAQPTTKPDSLRVLVFGEHKDFENRLDGLNSSDQEPRLPRFVFARGKGKQWWNHTEDEVAALCVWEHQIEDLGVRTDLLKNNFKIRPSWGPEDDW